MKFLDRSGLTQVWDAIKDRFQTKLVSGTNIKTINGESILTSGNIDAATQDWVNQQGFARGSFINSSGDTPLGDGRGYTVTTSYYGLAFKNKSKSGTFITLGHQGNIDDNSGTGWITCSRGDDSGIVIIQAGDISIDNKLSISSNQIDIPIDKNAAQGKNIRGIIIDNEHGIRLNRGGGLGLCSVDSNGTVNGASHTFWATDGGATTIEALTDAEVLEILV